MKRWLFASLLAAGLAAGLTPGRAAAQIVPFPTNFGRPPVNPQGAPAVSPFLNLSRTGSPAINYFAVVQPQLQAQESINQLQLQQYQLEQQQQMIGVPGLGGMPLLTGHDVRFMNYGNYFPSTVAGLGARR